MRYAILFLALLLATGSAAAQVSPVTVRPDSLAVAQTGSVSANSTSATVPDTVAAIHRLFASKRRRTVIATGLTLATGVLCAAIVHDAKNSRDINIIPGLAVLVGFLCVPTLPAEAGYYTIYTRRKEQRAIAAFKAHQLPKRIKYRLQPKYFVVSNRK